MNVIETINQMAEIFEGKSQEECNQILDSLNKLIHLVESKPNYVKNALYRVLRQAVERVEPGDVSLN